MLKLINYKAAMLALVLIQSLSFAQSPPAEKVATDFKALLQRPMVAANPSLQLLITMMLL